MGEINRSRRSSDEVKRRIQEIEEQIRRLGERDPELMDPSLNTVQKASLILQKGKTLQERYDLLLRHTAQIQERLAIIDEFAIPYRDKYRLVLEVMSPLLAINAGFRAHAKNLERLWMLDSLTGAYNRQGFEAMMIPTLFRFRDMLRLNKDARLSVIFFDLNKFKSINDTYGHSAGDHVLKQWVALLKSKARTEPEEIDIIMRYGGEEIVIVYVGLNPEQVTERFHDPETNEVMGTFPVEFISAKGKNQGEVIRIEMSWSAGITEWDPAIDASLWDTIERADRLMYEAKSERLSRINIRVDTSRAEGLEDFLEQLKSGD